MYVLNGQEFDTNLRQTIGGVQYPPGWFDDRDERARYGIVEAIETPPPAPAGWQRIVRNGVQQEESGKWLVQWQAVDMTPAEISNLRANLMVAVNTHCDALIETMTVSYPYTEKLTFSKQEAEARAYRADPAAITPLLDGLALNRGIAKVELVTRILAKADSFSTYTGLVIGRRQALEDAIKAATTLDALTQIDIQAGWPA